MANNRKNGQEMDFEAYMKRQNAYYKRETEKDEEPDEKEGSRFGGFAKILPLRINRQDAEEDEIEEEEELEETEEEEEESKFVIFAKRLTAHLSRKNGDEEEDDEDEEGSDEEEEETRDGGFARKLTARFIHKKEEEDDSEEENENVEEEETPTVSTEEREEAFVPMKGIDYDSLLGEGNTLSRAERRKQRLLAQQEQEEEKETEEEEEEEEKPSIFENLKSRLPSFPAKEKQEEATTEEVIDEEAEDEETETPSLFSLLKKRPAPAVDDEEEKEDTPSVKDRLKGFFIKKDEEAEDEEETEDQETEEGTEEEAEEEKESLLDLLKTRLSPARHAIEEDEEEEDEEEEEEEPVREHRSIQFLSYAYPANSEDDDYPDTRSSALSRLLNRKPSDRVYEDDDEYEDDADDEDEEMVEEEEPVIKSKKKMIAKAEEKSMPDTDNSRELTKQLSEALDAKPSLSRKERRALAAKGGKVEKQEPTKDYSVSKSTEEPTLVFEPVHSRPTTVVRPLYDDDDDDIKPMRKAEKKSKKAAHEEEFGAARDIYDDDEADPFDDYDDDDEYDEDDDEEQVSFGKRLLGFLKGLLTVVLILAILVCVALLLENKGIISLDFLRTTPVAEYLPEKTAEEIPVEEDTVEEFTTPEEEAEFELSEEEPIEEINEDIDEEDISLG